MEVFLDDETGTSVYTLQVQHKSSGLGVMLAGGVGRFMLAATEFVGRVRAPRGALPSFSHASSRA